MKTRIDSTFIALKAQGKKALIPFFMPGAHAGNSIADTILALEKNGADMIELGVPFSDPIADGPVIQRAAVQALKNGIKTNDVFAAIKQARKKTEVPILLLVYYNSIFKYGRERFVSQCVSAGVDGLIIPDLPFEEQGEMAAYTKNAPVNLITLVARTSKKRMQTILPNTEGFIYCVSTVGVTGERAKMHDNLPAFLDEIKTYTATPRAIGFGISTPAQAKDAAAISEGVIVGSALVRRLLDESFESAMDFVKQLRQAVDKA